jgi:hypothetical protein
MPIYEYYSPDTNRIYSFFAKTLAQGRLTPKCPDNPRARMVKLISGFSIGGRTKEEPAVAATTAGDPAEDARLDAAMKEMEGEMSSLDENDPRALARMMRRMSELAGEKLDEPMEEAVRKLEEGADPDALEEQMGDLLGGDAAETDSTGEGSAPDTRKQEPKDGRAKFKVRRSPPTRDPKLYDYE